ncbi:YggL family protein [Hymenobacter sp. BT175]|uniref:50S ribosome-binding protein YggL n=1 Tax=Hymenobacter translucens TaxID=2886507 RepID=UPI001D0F20E7|nr:50S ribosome-binding protein YggL [Hymenobacter translucens]MCC2546149.1 YggL family protein [Hymenobacter translucens]
MKKRLRKKLRLQEFQELGFSVRLKLDMPDTEEAYFSFFDRLIEAVEANSLLISGGLDHFFVEADSRRSATDADREALGVWLRQQPEVKAVTVGPLMDAWHGSFADDIEEPAP